MPLKMHNENEMLIHAMFRAIMAAANKLFHETGESFYYFTVTTNGEAQAPILSAWSKEKLMLVPESERHFVKWSYVDSPYCYFDDDSDEFNEVRRLFDQRPSITSLSEPLWLLEYDERLSLMEAALARVDATGIFGRDAVRDSIVINVEVMPPDETNTARAMRLNPAAALREWMLEAAE